MLQIQNSHQALACTAGILSCALVYLHGFFFFIILSPVPSCSASVCLKQALVFVTRSTLDQISLASIMWFWRKVIVWHAPAKGLGTSNASNPCQFHQVTCSSVQTEAPFLWAASIFTPSCTSSAWGCELRLNLLQMVWSHRTAHHSAALPLKHPGRRLLSGTRSISH